jgi:pyruvate dehydrogenase E1 component alpha subunit
LIEAKTYRYVGHSISDPQKYRSKEKVKAKREEDPIKIHKERMLKSGQLTEEEFKDMESEARTIAAESVAFAEQSPEPGYEEIFNDVLA